MSNNNNFEPYSLPSQEKMNSRSQTLETLWRNFLESEGESDLQYHVHKQNLFEVIKRQDQRMYYLKIFHGLDYPCEYKYIAIECFWINTLKPFIVTKEDSKIYDCPNERFSLYLILVTIRAIFEIYNKDKTFAYPSKKRIEDILYDFKYCSFSREAMISFVETLADNYGLGIDFILNHKNEIPEKIKNLKINSLFD